VATFAELCDIQRNDDTLKNRLPAPISKKCKQVLLDSQSKISAKEWAIKGYTNPESIKPLLIWPLLIANADKEVSEIKGATDPAIETQVALAIDNIIAGLPADPA
jgi:hypothetical protein